MTVYRICASCHSNPDGEGARLYGGRWNHKGTAVLYFGSTISLCALEVLANSDKLPANKVSIAAQIPADLHIVAYTAADLPSGWDAPVPGAATKSLGQEWARSLRSAVLAVPSSIILNEENFIINPAHPDFKLITFLEPIPFTFDPRLR